MLQKMEGVHVGFMMQVAGMSARKLGVDTCQNEGADRMLQATRTNPLQEYIERTQVAVGSGFPCDQYSIFVQKKLGSREVGGRKSSGGGRQPWKGG